MFKNDTKSGGVSSFKSLMTVLAATLGTGNIVGISSAICIGGIGSVFWIFLSGIFALATKYAETYLVLKYRKKEKMKNGEYTFVGGTMYVLRDVLNKKRLGTLFSIFVVIASFGIGAMIQSNAISTSIEDNIQINTKFLAIVITVLCSYFVFGDEKRISNISAILVPIASIIYLTMCVFLLYIFRYNILDSIKLIVSEALSLRSVGGSIFSIMLIKSMNAGLSKGLFSNEAGMGSSPLFNVTVKDSKTAKEEAIVASTSVYIDTVIICTLTGLVIASSGMYNLNQDSMLLTQNTFATIPYGNILLTFALSIFAVATIPCWSFYGCMGVRYLFKDKKYYILLYKLIYIFSVYIGAILSLNVVWSISSIANALMVLPNIYMLYKLRDKIES